MSNIVDYFAVSSAIEQRISDEMPMLDKVCSLFTQNDPAELKRFSQSAHINMLPSVFGNSSGHGKTQAETQRWQVSLCFAAPKTSAEVAALRQNAGDLCLKLRQTLQGWVPVPGIRPLQVVANQVYMTQDCRWRIFSFTFEANVVI